MFFPSYKITSKPPVTEIKECVISKQVNPQLSDTRIEIKPKVTSDASCPNFVTKRTRSSLSHPIAATSTCKTIYKNTKLFPKPDEEKFNKLLENQCSKLREEMAKQQATSMKERTVLSRKLEAVTKEKRELSKHLTFVQKENRGVKQELDELLVEKVICTELL